MKLRKLLLIPLLLVACIPARAQVQPVSATLTAASTGVCLPTNCLPYTVPSGVGSATFQIGGNTTFSGTVQFEVVLFDGSYYPLNATPAASTTAVTSATGPGSWQVNIAGYSTVRMRVTTLASGSVAAAINPSTASARAGGGGGAGAVSSVFARTGAVTAQSADYTCSLVTNCLSSAIPTTVSGATSGGIPCFDSSTDMNSSVAITNNDMIDGGGAGACAKDSGILSTNLVQLSLGSTQTLQCTQNGVCLIIKQSAAGGRPLEVENMSGGIAFYVDPAATQVNNMAGGLGLDFLNNGQTGALSWKTTAPTITAAGCGGSAASISTNNGGQSFKVNVGTSNTGTCTVTMTAATTDWVCSATDLTTTNTNVAITKAVPGGTPRTQVTLQNYTDVFGTHAWVDSDVIEVSCWPE